jgi:hypothetical protein
MSATSATPNRKRRRVAALLLGLAFALGAGELALRVLPPRYAPRRADYDIGSVSSEPASWVYAPGSTVRFDWDGDPLGVLPPGAHMEIPVNYVGLRGPLPTPSERCVVVLGDSFTFGEGVPDDETFVARLDHAWRSRGLSFVNAGVAGHGTVEEAARLEALLDRFKPVAVVLVHVPNDAIPWIASSEQASDLLNVEGADGVRLLALAKAITSSNEVEDWYLSYYRGDQAQHWERARKALIWMGRTCTARGAQFGVTTFPLMHRLDDYPLTAITSLVEGATKEAGGRFLDLTPSFAGRDAETLWCHPADRHPNARAHDLAADALSPFVAELVK